MSKKLTIEFIKESFEKEGYVLLDDVYINSSTKLKYLCPQGHTHNITYDSWKQGHKCPYCVSLAKLSIDFVKTSFESEGYALLSNEYINCRTKLNYICPKKHKHSITWGNWRSGYRCPTCAKKTKPSIELIKESFEAENYILLSDTYVNNHIKLNYICPQGHKHSISWGNWKTGYRCPTCFKNNNIKQGNPNWKGGVHERNVPLYDTYSHQIDYCEETRRDPNELDLLQVRCTKCGNWFIPPRNQVNSRIVSLNSNKGSSKFYCSDECKHSCSIYNRKKYSAEEKRSKTNPNFTSEELKVWSKEVLKRANNTCEFCGKKATDTHHIQPKKIEPFLALDPDNGVACCEECHYKYGHKDECSTGILANIICS